MKFKTRAISAVTALLLSLATSAAAAIPPAATRLQYVADSKDSVVFFAPAAVTKTPEGVDAWVLRADITPQEVSGKLLVGVWIYQRFDCKAATAAPLELVGVDAAQTPLFSNTPDPDPRAVGVGTPNALLYAHLCKNAKIGSGVAVSPNVAAAIRSAQAKSAGVVKR